jgi:hypothetical protein
MKEIITQLAANTRINGGLNETANSENTIGNSGMTNAGLFSGDDSIVTTVINTILYIVGIIAVIMLIIGGIKYATSSGDEKKVTSAKNTIIYAILGLAFAILAWTLVNFVFVSIGPES